MYGNYKAVLLGRGFKPIFSVTNRQIEDPSTSYLQGYTKVQQTTVTFQVSLKTKDCFLKSISVDEIPPNSFRV